MLLDAGVCTIYTVKPDSTLTEISKHYFGELAVGYARNQVARQNDERIDSLIRIWRDRNIRTTDRCQAFGEMHYIRQIQHKVDEDGMLVTDLSLERLETDEY